MFMYVNAENEMMSHFDSIGKIKEFYFGVA